MLPKDPLKIAEYRATLSRKQRGRKVSIETRQKIATTVSKNYELGLVKKRTHTNRPSGLVYNIKVVNKAWIKKGQQLSPETGFKPGHIPYNPIKPGEHRSPKTEFTSEITKGENNFQWKGDDVGYFALHSWVYRNLGKAKDCKRCGKIKKRYVWHNISGEYKRDLSDWKSVCDTCHKVEHRIMKGVL